MALTSDSSLKFISPYQALGRYQFIDGNWYLQNTVDGSKREDTAYKDIDDRFFLIEEKSNVLNAMVNSLIQQLSKTIFQSN